MKFINGEPNEVKKLALSMMLFSTCGEDEELMENAEIEEIAPDTYHVEYMIADPFKGVGLTVHINREMYAHGQCSVFHYNVLSSAYGDTGEFTLEIR